jgi:hypothetical protein
MNTVCYTGMHRRLHRTSRFDADNGLKIGERKAGMAAHSTE